MPKSKQDSSRQRERKREESRVSDIPVRLCKHSTKISDVDDASVNVPLNYYYLESREINEVFSTSLPKESRL
jgi:hypothetical protein